MNITISPEFRKMTLRSVLSIILFIATYISLIAAAVVLTIILGYIAFSIIALKAAFITLMLGLAIISIGIIILIFLFKFVTKKHKTDRSHLVEITVEEEPGLFKVISEVVAETATQFPKRVYLAYDVNAAVFYDSSFWSMFFPVRKNLQIGVGLINSVTASELKAILAHEFGHFSQRSMKLGSYVYNVNQVIYNLLYDNDSFNSIVEKLIGISSYFKFSAIAAGKIVQFIQWVLKKVYEIVNLNYMALSREMEFHADEVAANVAGKQSCTSSLLRLDFADSVFESVLNYYNNNFDNCITTKNIYSQHNLLLKFLGEENNLQIKNGLPEVTLDEFTRFKKSKLTIKDQWASHPTNLERIERIGLLKIAEKPTVEAPATTLLNNPAALQEKFTELLFKRVEFKQTPNLINDREFMDEYIKNYLEGSFNKIYNGYYDHKNFAVFNDVDAAVSIGTYTNESFSTLFSGDAIETLRIADALESDIEQLKYIAEGKTDIKTFDYDGQRYVASDSSWLATQLESNLKQLKAKIEEHDKKIYSCFVSNAKQAQKGQEWKELDQMFTKVKNEFSKKYEFYVQMVQQTRFIEETTPFETIEQNLVALAETEKDFKVEIEKLLNAMEYQPQLTKQQRADLQLYILKDWTYFNKPDYDDHSLQVMFKAVNTYREVIADTLFKLKKLLLEFQSELLLKNDEAKRA